jgi:hypothetical protein
MDALLGLGFHSATRVDGPTADARNDALEALREVVLGRTPAAAAPAAPGSCPAAHAASAAAAAVTDEPMWKVKERMAHFEAQREQRIEEELARKEEDRMKALPPNVLVDAVSVSSSSTAPPPGGAQKPLVRHVVVKDMLKVAARSQVELPRTGLFKQKAPIGLYAVFDGTPCAASTGASAAEFCARSFHTRFLSSLSYATSQFPNEAFVRTVLRNTVLDLERELHSQFPDAKYGCAAAVAVIIGDYVFTACIGQCGVVLADAALAVSGDIGLAKNELQLRPVNLTGLSQANAGSHSQPMQDGITIVRGHGSSPPTVAAVELRGCDQHPFLLLTSSSVTRVLTDDDLIKVASFYRTQPRACCGQVATKALEACNGGPGEQCVVMQICWLPRRQKPGDPISKAFAVPAAKKAKLGHPKNMLSMRLRHILVKYQQPGKLTAGPTSKKLPTVKEAEAMLRRAIRDLQKQITDAKKTPKDADDIVKLQTATFVQLCREMSSCPSSQKPGTMCGDLGWKMPDDLAKMGASVSEKLGSLKLGQWSDITPSDNGLHLFQRIA